MATISTSISVTQNTTYSVGDILIFEGSGKFVVGANVTVTILSEIVAPMRQIFDCSAAGAKVVGIRKVYPEWWGASEAATDNAPFIQQAINCAQDSFHGRGGAAEVVLSAHYGVRQGVFITPGINLNVRLVGSGMGRSRLIARGSGWQTAVVNVNGRNDVEKTSDFVLRDFGIIAEATDAPIGLTIGTETEGYDVQGKFENLIEGIVIEGFPLGIRMQRARLLKFHRVGVWQEAVQNGVAVEIRVPSAVSSAGEVGDCDFVDCQFVSSAYAEANLTRGFLTRIENQALGGIQGLRLTRCIFYRFHTAVHLEDNPNSKIRSGAAYDYGSNITDIWIQSCQFDGTGGRGVYMLSHGNNTSKCWISNVHITDNYFQGMVRECVKAEAPSAVDDASAYRARNIFVSNNWSAAGAHSFGDFYKVGGVSVVSNQIWDNNYGAGPAIVFHTTTKFVCVGNLMNNGTTKTPPIAKAGSFIQVNSPSDWFTIDNNNSGGCVTTVINKVPANYAPLNGLYGANI